MSIRPMGPSQAGLAGAYAPAFVFTGTRSSADAAALATFVETMRASGKLNGHLHLKNTKLTTAVVIDGGYTDVTNEASGHNWDTTTRDRVNVTAEDLEIDPAVAVGITIKGVMGCTLDVNLHGGGYSAVFTDASISSGSGVITSITGAAVAQVGMHAVLGAAGPTAGDEAQPLVGMVTAVDTTAHTITINDLAGNAVVSAGSLRLSTVGVHLENAVRVEGKVRGKNHAGLVFRIDATGDTTKRVRESMFDGFNFMDCGQGLSIKSVESFGSLGRVWSAGNQHGDYIGLCADTGWEHYEGGVGTANSTSTKYLWFDRCTQMNGGKTSIGDRATKAAVLITGPGNFGEMALRVTGYAPSNVQQLTGVQLRDVDNITLRTLRTAKCLIGAEIIGSNVTVAGEFHSLTTDRVAVHIKPSTYNAAPRVKIPNANIDFTYAEAVIVAASMTGGKLTLGGNMRRLNQDGTAGRAGVDCLSSAFVVDASGLTAESSTLAASVRHVTPANLLLSKRASLANGPVAPGSGTVTSTAQQLLSNTTTDTVIAGPLTIPAGQVKAGNSYRVRAWGTVDNDAGATVTLRGRVGGVGGTSVAAPLAITNASAKTNQAWSIDWVFQFRADAAASTAVVVGGIAYQTTSGSPSAQGNASSNVNMTVSRDIVVDATWSAATATNILRVEGYVVEQIA